MATWHFYGEVRPSQPALSLKDIASITWDETTTIGLHMVFTIEITNSNVHVSCEVNRDNAHDIGQLRMRSLELAKAYVNIISFKLGRGLSVDLDRVILPSGGEKQTIYVHNPALEACATAFNDISNFDGVDTIVTRNPSLMRLLDELIIGLTTAHALTKTCAIVVDGIKHLISPSPSQNDKAKWRAMQHALNLDGAYLSFITEASREPRHGKIGPISDAKANEIQIRTWTVMNRYLLLKKHAGTQLPLADHPLLTG